MNSQNRWLQGTTVVTKAGRVFRCLEGDGCDPLKQGDKIRGRYLDETGTVEISGDDIDRIASLEEKRAAVK